jgi:hypothetical protein
MIKQELREFVDKIEIDNELLDTIKEDCLIAEDGYYVFWPQRNSGFYTEYHLLQIFAFLNRSNREWDDGVDEFFR